MRDTHATGKGSIMGAGTAGYCTGNLRMDNYLLPHEDTSFPYPRECLCQPLTGAASGQLGRLQLQQYSAASIP